MITYPIFLLIRSKRSAISRAMIFIKVLFQSYLFLGNGGLHRRKKDRFLPHFAQWVGSAISRDLRNFMT